MPQRFSLGKKVSVWIGCVLVSIACQGCEKSQVGEGRIEISGKVLKDGQPLEVADRERGLGQVLIEFHPLDESGQLMPGAEPEGGGVNENGEFNLFYGVPAGKYRVAIYQWDPYPSTDKLEGRFNQDSSPIVREVGEGKNEFVIELADEAK